MSKFDTRREDLVKNIMKNVIIRVDYQGIVDIFDSIKEFQERFNDKFSSYITTTHNTLNITINDIEQISDSLSIPIGEVKKQTIHRFEKNKFGTDEVTFDVTKYYSVLTVKCINYVNIDPYLDFFADYCDFIAEINPYVSAKRLGLRKIGSNIYTNPGQIFSDFNARYFNLDFDDTGFSVLKNRYVDVLEKSDDSSIINYVRSYEKGLYMDETSGKPEPIDAFQIQLDFDAYFDDQKLTAINFKLTDARGVLRKTNDEDLFPLFLMTVTDGFIQKYKASKNEGY